MASTDRGPDVNPRPAERDPLGPNYASEPKRSFLPISIAVGMVIAMLAIFIVAFFLFVG